MPAGLTEPGLGRSGYCADTGSLLSLLVCLACVEKAFTEMTVSVL